MDKEKLHDQVINYKPQMTDEERLEKYMRGERVDHLPFYIRGFDQVYGHIMGYSTAQMIEDFDIFSKLVQKRIEAYHIDGINFAFALTLIGDVCGSDLYFTDGNCYFADHFLMADKKIDMSKVALPDPKKNPALKIVIEIGKKIREKFPNQKIIATFPAPFTTAATLRPLEKLLRDVRKDPQGLKELMEFSKDCGLKWTEVFQKVFGPNVSVSLIDPATSTDLLRPKQFDEFSLPYLRDLVDGIVKITGNKPPIHMCGGIKDYWDRLYDLNISSISVDNLESLSETKEAFGDKITIEGNVPTLDVLLQGSPEDVIKAVKNCIINGADSPKGYVISTGCVSEVNTPPENLDAFIYAVRKYSAGAKLGEIPEAVYQD
ncbi:MAG: uroporphyrinogen decarboxylase family protein [Finegoldia sp.]|nr:uroporphyrinogen decarboxylase family protein [Finegoldia sp.]